MFVCNTCLERYYDNEPSIAASYGSCEVCRVMASCSDIPSGALQRRRSRRRPPAAPVAVPPAPEDVTKTEEKTEEKLPPPTHVLVGTSDGEKLTGERWMSLEDFAALFTYGETRSADGRGWPTRDIRLKRRE